MQNKPIYSSFSSTTSSKNGSAGRAEFLKTKLSKEEEGVFKSLKTNVNYTEKLELISIDKTDSHQYLIAAYGLVLQDLNSLSAIQIKEGANLFYKVQINSSTILIKSELFWALALIVLMAIISSVKNKGYKPLKTN